MPARSGPARSGLGFRHPRTRFVAALFRVHDFIRIRHRRCAPVVIKPLYQCMYTLCIHGVQCIQRVRGAAERLDSAQQRSTGESYSAAMELELPL